MDTENKPLSKSLIEDVENDIHKQLDMIMNTFEYTSLNRKLNEWMPKFFEGTTKDMKAYKELIHKIGYHIVSVGVIIDSIDEKLLGLSLKKLADEMDVYRSFKVISSNEKLNDEFQCV